MPMKLGRRAPSQKRALRLGSYLQPANIPDHPDQLNYLPGFTGWQVLGNDKYGDCVAVAVANNRAEITAVLTGAPHYPSLDEVLAFYRTQNPGFPGQDAGMDMQQACEALTKVGIAGVKALGFAKVDHTNHEQLKAAIAVFGSVLVGVNVTQANMDGFDAGARVWDAQSGSADVGGHAMHSGGYGHSGDAPGELKSITWAAEIGLTDRFWVHQIEEAWAVIWPEHLQSKTFLAGMDLTTFAADYREITGAPFPGVIPPTPVPAPVPAPPVPMDDLTFARYSHQWLARNHSGLNRSFATVLQQYLQAKGL